MVKKKMNKTKNILIGIYNRLGKDEIKECAICLDEDVMENINDDVLNRYKKYIVYEINSCYKHNINENDITFIVTKDLDIITGFKDNIKVKPSKGLSTIVNSSKKINKNE